MSRNKDRLGLGDSKPESSNPPPQVMAQSQNDNPFSFIVPTEFVELPSKGKFYDENHPLHNQETIEIKQMTAKEEDILTNQNYIQKGVVLDKLLESLVQGDFDLDDLCTGEDKSLYNDIFKI